MSGLVFLIGVAVIIFGMFGLYCISRGERG